MRKYYDKALFFLALVLFSLGLGLFFQNGGFLKATSIPGLSLSGMAYVPVPAHGIIDPKASWTSPPDQGEETGDLGWVYSVFTPPKIYWDHGFIVKPLTPPPPFGLTFVKAEQDLYRVQIQGVAGHGDRNDVIAFRDVENDNSDFRLSLAPGKSAESASHKIKVLDISFATNGGEPGLVNKVAQVKILDEQSNQEVTLTQGQTYSPTGNRYYILHTEGALPSEDWKITAVGDKRAYPGELLGFTGTVTYEVTALNFEQPSVTVVRHSYNRKGIETTSAPKELGTKVEEAP